MGSGLMMQCARIICYIMTFYILGKIWFKYYQRSFFKSKKFRELSEKTDDVAEQYHDLIALIKKFKSMTYADFIPNEEKQIQLVDGNKKIVDQNKKLQPYTYYCSPKIIESVKGLNNDVLRDYCGFVANSGVVSRLTNMHNTSLKIMRGIDEFEEEYEKQFDYSNAEMPLLIKLFARQKFILMAGLEIDESWKDDVWPRYTFVDVSKPSNKGAIILNPEKIGELKKYLEGQFEPTESPLLLRKELIRNAK